MWISLHIATSLLVKITRKMRSEHTVFVKTCHIVDDLVDQINKFPGTSYKDVFIILTVISAMLTFTAISVNACTVFTILKTTVLRKKLSNFTIMVQSTIDLLNGTFLMPLFTYVMVSKITETGNCFGKRMSKKNLHL